MFDRTQKDFQCGYTPPEIEKARTFVAKPDWDAMMRDTDAAIKELKSVGPVGIIGFCMGGTIAFLAATRLSGLSAAVGYYGGRIVAFADEKPKCPVQLHFGEKDASIPMTDVEIIKQKRGGDCEIYVYRTRGHGFHCDERGSFHKDEPRPGLAAHHGFLRQAHEEVRRRRVRSRTCFGRAASDRVGQMRIRDGRAADRSMPSFHRKIGATLTHLAPHFSVSSATQLAELAPASSASASPPSSAMRACIFGSASAALNALFRTSTTSGGMPFGPATP